MLRPSFFVSLLVTLAVIAGPHSVRAQAQLTDGRLYIQVASHPTLEEAIARAAALTQQFPATSVYYTSSGWYAVVIGTISAESATSFIAGLVAQSSVPSDTLSTPGKGYIVQVWPEKTTPAPTGRQREQAQDVALLLFDSETQQQFVGCLNCNRYSDGSVCNRYGDYGSRYSDTSIWNRYGTFGSRYEESSPWNRYGECQSARKPDPLSAPKIDPLCRVEIRA